MISTWFNPNLKDTTKPENYQFIIAKLREYHKPVILQYVDGKFINHDAKSSDVTSDVEWYEVMPEFSAEQKA